MERNSLYKEKIRTYGNQNLKALIGAGWGLKKWTTTQNGVIPCAAILKQPEAQVAPSFQLRIYFVQLQGQGSPSTRLT